MAEPLGSLVRRALIWRSGSQVVSQLVAWGSTLMVVRLLEPADYGLFAMSQVVLVFLSFLNGYGFASSLIQDREVTEQKIRQCFGMLLIVNGGIALAQVLLAPWVAAYFRQPLVADLLRVQALLFLATPFIALPDVLLMRAMDFRRQALVTFAATLVSAGIALGGALAGWGVWTLVYAALALVWTRAVGLTLAARRLVWPSFDFRGAGGMFTFGLVLLGSHLFWTVMNQADTFIAGRVLSAHELGLYTEALFLTMIMANKFVPPLNDVAFPAYARLQHDPAALSAAFLKAVRLIMLATLPVYAGIAVTAQPAIALVFGEKWLAMAPIASTIALAMPVYTLHILFAPALNGVGKPRVALISSAIGAAVMVPAFLVATRWGPQGLAWAWVLAFPVVPLATYFQARKVLGLDLARLGAAIAPPLVASVTMALLVMLFGRGLAGAPVWLDFPAQALFGALVYVAVLWVFWRASLDEVVALVFRRHSLAASLA